MTGRRSGAVRVLKDSICAAAITMLLVGALALAGQILQRNVAGVVLQAENANVVASK